MKSDQGDRATRLFSSQSQAWCWTINMICGKGNLITRLFRVHLHCDPVGPSQLKNLDLNSLGMPPGSQRGGGKSIPFAIRRFDR